jgi:hypothetical protein
LIALDPSHPQPAAKLLDWCREYLAASSLAQIDVGAAHAGGYARVSTDAQSLDAQMAALKPAGCERVYAEKRSGAERSLLAGGCGIKHAR